MERFASGVATRGHSVVGDLNEVTSQAEKQGGRPFRTGQCRDLNNFVDKAGLVDLGYSGCPFTWKNARDGAALINERLDRALANATMLDNFPHMKVSHLPRTHSNHAPIIVSFFNEYSAGPFPFRCKEVWMDHPDFKDFFTKFWNANQTEFLVRRKNFLDNITFWNTNVFGNLEKAKKKLLARINGIQIALAKKHSKFLINLEKLFYMS